MDKINIFSFFILLYTTYVIFDLLKKQNILLIFLVSGFTLIPFFSIDAITYDDSVFTLTWNSITNAIVLDVDKNGYADQIYRYSISGQDIIFTKVLGDGATTGTITMPTSYTLRNINVEKDMIFVGSGLVSGANCTTTLATYNITSNTIVNSALTYNITGVTGTNAIKFVLGMLGISNEPVLHGSCESATVFPVDYTVKNSTNTILSKRDNVAFSISSQEPDATGIVLSSNGTKMYVIGQTNDRIYQYTLSNDNDVSSATYDNVNFSVNAQETTSQALKFNSDGTKVFIVGNTADTVFEYALSNPYQISSASYGGVNKLVSAQTTIPNGLAFSTNGTKMYVLDQGGTVFQYTLGTAFTVSTASYDSVSLSVVACDNVFTGLDISSDGSKLYVTSNGASDFLCQYNLSNPYQVSSGTLISAFSLNPQDSTNHDSFMIDNGNYFLTVGTGNDRVYRYTTSTDFILTGSLFRIGTTAFGYTPLMTYANIEHGYAVDTNSIIDEQFVISTNVTNGLCNNSGCLTNMTDQTISIKASSIASSIGAYVSPTIKLFNGGLVMPSSLIQDSLEYFPVKNTYWYSHLPILNSNVETVLSLLHLKILNPSLTTDPYRFIFDDDNEKYIVYINGNDVLYSSFNDLTLSTRAIGYYYPDAVTDLFDNSITNNTLASNSYDLVSPTGRTTFTNIGLVSIISGYELQTASSVIRTMNPEANNSPNLVPYTIGVSASQKELTLLIKNSPSSASISIQDENNKLLTSYYQWSQDYLKADKTFDVDLPDPYCVDVYLKDLTLNNTSWDFLGNVCNTGIMPKTIVYSSNLSFTFWSLPYGVSHTFAQESETLHTKVRHDTFPFNYTVKIFDSNDVLAYTQEFNSTNEIDIQSINASGISRPALIKVFDVNDNQLYYATIGTPSYFSDSVAWFEEWLSIEGFNLLFMLPIVFSAMFTRNTVGIGTTITVVFIATLTWVGILPIPDNVIYFMIAIGIVGMIAHKKLYD